MKKHDLLSVLFCIAAASAAGLFLLEYQLTGQIIYTVSLLGASLMTKKKAATFQGTIALLVCAGAGYVSGDWWLSAAAVMANLAVTLRIFVLRDRIFTPSTVWIEPIFAVIGAAIYVTANLIHDNHWMAWIVPSPMIVLGILVSGINVADRKKVSGLLQNALIEIGSPAPVFSLTNHAGENISLDDYKNHRDVLLIFVRGDWCPSCHIMLRLYERERKKFQDKNIMLFAIGPDPVGVNRAMVEKLGVEFAVLSDDTMDVTRSYCLEIQTGMGKPFEAGVPLPASFLIDKQGIVRYTSRANNAGEFLRPDLIFDVLAKI